MSHRDPLTVFLPDLQQHRLPQVDGEGFILLILLIVNDLHLQDFPVVDKDIKFKCFLNVVYFQRMCYVKCGS